MDSILDDEVGVVEELFLGILENWLLTLPSIPSVDCDAIHTLGNSKKLIYYAISDLDKDNFVEIARRTINDYVDNLIEE